MSFCKHRVVDRCKKYDRLCIFSPDCFEPEEEKSMTNADRIRAMSDEELVSWMKKIVDCADCPAGTKCIDISQKCEDLLLEWLQQPAEG